MKTTISRTLPDGGTGHATENVWRSRRIIGVFISLFFTAILTSQAQDGTFENGVTIKNHTVYRVQNGQFNEITNTVTLPCHDVEVDTNGTFTVDQGNERQLQEGQVIRDDCWMTSPDGSAEPVYNHIAAKAGKIYVVRDGRANQLTEPMTFTNRLHLTPDGWCDYPDGTHQRLQDGQLFQMDGSAIQAMDAVTLANGQVVVQKSGSLIHLAPVQIMGMDNGSRVSGDGTIRQQTGSIIHLKTGETVLIPGIIVRHMN